MKERKGQLTHISKILPGVLAGIEHRQKPKPAKRKPPRFTLVEKSK
jgi:hypothetical protein